MNKCYRLVFNRCSQTWQAVAENVSGHGRGGYKLLAASVLAAAIPLAHAQTTDPRGYTELGDIGNSYSAASAISADGTTIIGTGVNSNSRSQAFYWTKDAGINALDYPTFPSGANASYGYAVNADGSVIVGSVSNGSYSRAFRWSADTNTMIDLGTLETVGGTSTASFSTSTAYAVNGDGSIVAGEAITDNNQYHAFRWVDGTGMTQLFTEIGTVTVGTSTARGINKAGDVIVGDYNDGNNHSAFRWVENVGAESLGAIDQNDNTDWESVATAVNAAGNVVVGFSSHGTDSSAAHEAFRWTADTGMVGLGTLGDFANSYANATDSSGNIVVGSATDSSTVTGTSGFRWTAGTGMQTIEDWLEDSGVDTSGLTDTATSANGISADGTIIVGTLSNGIAYLARGEAGLIDVAAFNNSLSRTAASAVLAENQNDLVFHGMHGNPMQMLLKTGGSGFWVAGDLGRQERDARKSDMAIGEIGYGYRISDNVQFNVAAGHTYSKAGTDNGGKTRVNSNFILPEVIFSLPGSLYATVSGMYAKGSAKIDRGYLNTGTQVLSKGSPDTTTFGARIRLDWHEMANVGGVTLTPYVGLSYLQTTIDAYTETGGGFPVSWDKREEKATTARVGLDIAKLVGETTKFTGRIEGVHRFEKENVGASGQILGLGGFSFAGQSLKQNWLRAGAGLEGKLGSGIASATINATTEGEAAAYWLAVNYRWQF